MRATFLVAVSLAAVALLVAPALAQGPGGRFGGAGMLLQNEGVQKELKISEEQLPKLKELGEKIREKFKEDFAKLRDLPEQERREKAGELMKTVAQETHKALADILKPEQIKRLKQIELQMRGAEAFQGEEVQKALKLTDEQKGKLKTIGEDARKAIGEIFENAKGDREGARKKMGELRKETLEKTAAVLTDEQKKTWKEMTGEPFEIKFERRPEGRKPKEEKKSK